RNRSGLPKIGSESIHQWEQSKYGRRLVACFKKRALAALRVPRWKTVEVQTKSFGPEPNGHEITKSMPLHGLLRFPAEQQNVVLINSATPHEAERLIASCEHCNLDGAEIPFDGSGANSQVEKLWRLGVLSPRSGGQNSRPDCRRCRRSARQLSDLELSFFDLFRQFDAADRDCRRVESLEPQHRHNPLFYPAMILLHDIVQIFAGSDPHTTRHATLGFQFADGPM